MRQSKGRLALAPSHYGTVLNLSNAPSAQAPESPRVALSEQCSWHVERAPSRIVLICHESEAGLPKGARMPGRWSPQTAAPALISQLGATKASPWNKHLYGKDRESLVNKCPSCFPLLCLLFFQKHARGSTISSPTRHTPTPTFSQTTLGKKKKICQRVQNVRQLEIRC